MCYYVLLILREESVAKLGDLKSRLECWPELDRDRRLRPIVRSWGSAWETGPLVVFHTNPGRCACGWYFPPAARGPDEDERLRQEEARLFDRYQAKGWTYPKIERALSDWRAAEKRRAERDAKRLFVSDLVADVADAAGDLGVVPIWSKLGDSGPLRLGEFVHSNVVRGADEHELGARFAVDEVTRVIGLRRRVR